MEYMSCFRTEWKILKAIERVQKRATKQIKDGVPSKFEISDGCPLWILHAEKEHSGQNVWEYDVSVP